MTSPLQGHHLARVQSRSQSLPSLAEMRTGLLQLETKESDPLVRQVFGTLRTMVDHLSLLSASQRAQATAIGKHRQDLEEKFAGLVNEVNAAFSPPDGAPGPVAEQEAAPAAVPTTEVAPPTVEAPPQMTVTPVVKPKAGRRAGEKQ